MQKAYVENDQKLFDAEDKLYELQEVMRSPVTLSSVKSVNYNTVNVTWKSVNGAEGYQVYRKTAGGSYKEIAAVSGRETTAYRDTGLTTGTVYTYTVRAVYTLGGEKQLGDYVKSGITGKAMPEKTVISKVQSWGSPDIETYLGKGERSQRISDLSQDLQKRPRGNTSHRLQMEIQRPICITI